MSTACAFDRVCFRPRVLSTRVCFRPRVLSTRVCFRPRVLSTACAFDRVCFRPRVLSTVCASALCTHTPCLPALSAFFCNLMASCASPPLLRCLFALLLVGGCAALPGRSATGARVHRYPGIVFPRFVEAVLRLSVARYPLLLPESLLDDADNSLNNNRSPLRSGESGPVACR
jgi:hypothetical protein